MTKDIIRDITIIGAGPVGISAVFQAGMLNMTCNVVDILDKPGGQCSYLYPEKMIYDIPGYTKISAQDLIDNLLAQANPFKPKYYLNQKVLRINQLEECIEVITSLGIKIYSKTVVIATGGGSLEPNKIPLKIASQLEDIHIFYSVQSIEKFKDKSVMILGGGDSAVDWALNLFDSTKKIYLVHRREKFTAIPSNVDKLKELSQIKSTKICFEQNDNLYLEQNDSLKNFSNENLCLEQDDSLKSFSNEKLCLEQNENLKNFSLENSKSNFSENSSKDINSLEKNSDQGLDCLLKSHKLFNKSKEPNSIEILTGYQLSDIIHLNQISNLEESVKSNLKVHLSQDDINKTVEVDYILPFYGLKKQIFDLKFYQNEEVLSLDKLGNRISVNQFMQTSIKNIYAIGDISYYQTKLKLIMTGFAEGAVACHDIYSKIHHAAPKFEYSTTKGIPSGLD